MKKEFWNKMLKAYIVDDEPLARDELKYLLNRTKVVEVLGESDGIDTAKADIQELKPDVIFIDIELDEENGLSLAKDIGSFEHTPAIVFATAYDEYALQAFEASAFDYILKPIDEKRLQQTIEKIMNLKSKIENLPQQRQMPNKQVNEKLAVLVDDRIVLLKHEDILFIHSANGKSMIKTMEQEYTVGEPLVVLEKKLDEALFMRVHRGYIVNIDHIVEIEPWFNSTYNLILQDQSKVPVSRTYVKPLKQLMGF